MHTFICICLCVYAEANRNVRWVRMMHWNRSKVEKEQKDTHRKHEQKRKKPGRRIRHPCNEKTHCEQQKCYRSSNSLTHIIQCILGFSLYFEPTTQQQQALKTSSSLPYYKFSMYCEYVAVLSSAQKTIQYIAFFFLSFSLLAFGWEQMRKPSQTVFGPILRQLRPLPVYEWVKRSKSFVCMCMRVFWVHRNIVGSAAFFRAGNRVSNARYAYAVLHMPEKQNKNHRIHAEHTILYIYVYNIIITIVIIFMDWKEVEKVWLVRSRLCLDSHRMPIDYAQSLVQLYMVLHVHAYICICVKLTYSFSHFSLCTVLRFSLCPCV